MSWNTVRLGDATAVPWRNGGGLTRELASSSKSEDWIWRMSVAEVTTDGPFSCFDGVTRWFAVLQGAGVVLNFPAAAEEFQLTVEAPPFRFDGAVQTQCRLLGGPTQDFNLMVRDACLPAHMVRVRGEYQKVLLSTKLVAVYAIESDTRVKFDTEEIILPQSTLVWRTVNKAATVHIESAHALWIALTV